MAQLAVELQKLKESNAAQVRLLKDEVQKRMSELEDDLNCRTYYNFYLAQGQAAGADGRHEDALDSFRRALQTYKAGKTRGLFATENGGRVVRNISHNMARGLARSPLICFNLGFSQDALQGQRIRPKKIKNPSEVSKPVAFLAEVLHFSEIHRFRQPSNLRLS